jgi:hypothetical protein
MGRIVDQVNGGGGYMQHLLLEEGGLNLACHGRMVDSPCPIDLPIQSYSTHERSSLLPAEEYQVLLVYVDLLEPKIEEQIVA